MTIVTNYRMSNDKSEQATFPSWSILDLITTYNANVNMNTSNETKMKDKGTKRSLPAGFRPGLKDVICGRGRLCFNHEGNRAFRKIVDSFVPEYFATNNKFDKSILISTIVDCIRASGGEFVRQDRINGTYYEVGDFIAREKTSQTFRDTISRQDKSPENSQQKNEDIDKKLSACDEKSTNDICNRSSLPLNRNLLDSTSSSLYTTIVPPSFWKNNDNEKIAPAALNHRIRSSLFGNIEEDEFDKMIDEVIKPLPHHIHNLKCDNMIDDSIIRPLFREKQNNDDVIIDQSNSRSSMSSLETIDWKALLNDDSECSFTSIIPSPKQEQVSLFASNNGMSNVSSIIHDLPIDFSNIFDDDEIIDNKDNLYGI